MRQMCTDYQHFGHKKMTYVDWWAMLIANSFSPLETPRPMVEELIGVFSSDAAYGTFPDVEPLLKQLQAPDYVCVVSSNGDPRVPQILRSLGLLQYFQKTYLSYDLGVAKPDVRFFDHVIDDLRGPFTSREAMVAHALHVGDGFEKDLQGAYRAGWSAVLVDRQGDFASLSAEPVVRMGKKSVVQGLDELLPLVQSGQETWT